MAQKRIAESHDSISGKLLVAHPSLRDPNFRHTVLYISEHTASDGALGFVLNRPMAGTGLGQLVKGEHPPKVSGIPVYWGGPVATHQLSIARISWRGLTRRIDFENSLPVERAATALEDPESTVRAFVGYAGWAAGQLEQEMYSKAWVAVDAGREHFDAHALPGLWASIMRSLGPWFELQAGEPEDPGLN